MEITDIFMNIFALTKAHTYSQYSKTCVKWPLSKRLKIGFQDQLSLNAGQKYCIMLQGEHSAIFLIFNKLQFVIKIFVLSIYEWPSGHFIKNNIYHMTSHLGVK